MLLQCDREGTCNPHSYIKLFYSPDKCNAHMEVSDKLPYLFGNIHAVPTPSNILGILNHVVDWH